MIKNKLNKLSLIAVSVLMLCLLGLPAVVTEARESRAFAETTQTETETENETETSSQSDSVKKTETETEKKDKAESKLAATKLKICQNREKTINKIMDRISTRGQKQLDLFSAIAQKTEDFYVKKGMSLSNYDALVAEVNAKKAAAQATVDEVKAKVVDFKCDGTDPKGVASSFKQSLKDEIAALKAYKTAVKNLIVGVKSAQSTSSSAETNSEGN